MSPAMLQQLLNRPAEALAVIRGSEQYPALSGEVWFFPLWGGTLVAAEVTGLPSAGMRSCAPGIHGFHIHEGGSCSQGSDPSQPIPDTLAHYNPRQCPHPGHAGDLPPLFGNDGYAFQIFYTDQFVPEEVIGRTVVIHSSVDDFTSQPAGNSGSKIACGRIISPLQTAADEAGTSSK